MWHLPIGRLVQGRLVGKLHRQIVVRVGVLVLVETFHLAIGPEVFMRTLIHVDRRELVGEVPTCTQIRHF